MEFIKHKIDKKSEFTISRNGIKENVKQKIFPTTFCTNRHILRRLACSF